MTKSPSPSHPATAPAPSQARIASRKTLSGNGPARAVPVIADGLELLVDTAATPAAVSMNVRVKSKDADRLAEELELHAEGAAVRSPFRRRVSLLPRWSS